MNLFFGGSESTLWPFRFAPSGSANRSLPRRVPIFRQELDSLPHPGTCEPCQAPHTITGSISWSRRPEIAPIPRRTHFLCVASPHERVAIADRADRQLAYRTVGLRAGSFEVGGLTNRGQQAPALFGRAPATRTETVCASALAFRIRTQRCLESRSSQHTLPQSLSAGTLSVSHRPVRLPPTCSDGVFG